MEPGIKFIQDLSIILLAAYAGGRLARLLGISSVVGYLIAGIMIGTAELLLHSITEPERLNVLSNIGIAFVMFSIGLNTRISDLRSSGLAPLVAVTITALCMLAFGRILGGLIGLNKPEGLLFTAMLMVSSSISVGKLLIDNGLAHQHIGQMARNQTMIETILAVIFISSLTAITAGESSSITPHGVIIVITKLIALAVLVGVIGMIFVPYILRRKNHDEHGELQMIFLVGVLLGLSLMTVYAGYSLILGAFLAGLIVSEIPRSQVIERMFTGIRDFFAAIFFVIAGMMTNMPQIYDSIGLIFIGVILAMVGRFLASAFAWALACESELRAAKIAMLVTPTGAFSIMIVRIGIENGLLPEKFRATVVGIIIATGVFGSLCIKHVDKVDRLPLPEIFQTILKPLSDYRRLWRHIKENGGFAFLWNFIRPRSLQVIRELLCISAVFIFANPICSLILSNISSYPRLVSATGVIVVCFWFFIAVITLPSIIALLRNLDAICMMISDFFSGRSSALLEVDRLRLTLLRTLTFSLTFLWLFNLIPLNHLGFQAILLILIPLFAIIKFGWSNLIKIHSSIELKLSSIAATDYTVRENLLSPFETSFSRSKWKINLIEFKLPDLFFGAGWSIADFNLRKQTGAYVIGIDRQGFAITQISSRTQLFSGDTLFLIGEPTQIQAAIDLLTGETGAVTSTSELHRLSFGSFVVSSSCQFINQAIIELEWPRKHGLQVIAARRNHMEYINPDPEWIIRPKDELLVAGVNDSIETFRQTFKPPLIHLC